MALAVEAKSVAVHDDGLKSVRHGRSRTRVSGNPLPWSCGELRSGPGGLVSSLGLTPVPAVTCAKMLCDPERGTSPFARKPSLSNESTCRLGRADI